MAVCSWCGASETEPPATWTRQVTDRGEQWFCDRCTRENLRAIEARLDTEWW